VSGDDGTQAWYAFVCDYDAASACSSSSQGSGTTGSPFVVDATAPTVTVTSPTNGSYTSNTSVSFAADDSAEANPGFLVPNLDSSLVSWWRMEDTSGTTVTDYMSANNGTSVQNTSALTTTGKFGKALTFNGSSDYINAGSSFPKPVTISAWFDINTTGNYDTIFQYGDNSGDHKSMEVMMYTTTNLLYLDTRTSPSVYNYYSICDLSSLNSGVIESGDFVGGENAVKDENIVNGTIKIIQPSIIPRSYSEVIS
jgi:hypothetical protein